MRRAFSTLLLIAFGVAAMAQSSFTIVRPTDGSKVREQIKVQIPLDSLGEGDYVGIFVGGKFIEAVAPPPKPEGDAKPEKFFVYVLDTKKRGIPDGPVQIKAVQYSTAGGAPIIKETTSVDVNVENSASIPVPEDGFQLRYKWVPGKRYTYDLSQLVAYSSISDRQKQLGGTAAELEMESEHLLMEYEVVNSYPSKEGTDGLIRIQPLPEKGKDKVFLRTAGNPDGQLYDLTDMQPLYMRVTQTGREVFGSVPPYISSDLSNQSMSNTLLLAAYPLPTLPSKAIKPGDPYSTGFQLGNLDLSKLFETKALSSAVEARGEFLSVEWEMNHPCAKLRLTKAMGAQTAEGQRIFSKASGDISAQTIEETIYFALDLGMVIKMVRDLSVEVKATQQAAGPAAGGRGQQGGSPGQPGGPSAAGSQGGGGGGGAVGGGNLHTPGGPGNIRLCGGGGGNPQGGGGPPPGFGGPPGGGGPPPGMGGGKGGPAGGGQGFGRGARGAAGGGAGNGTVTQTIRLKQTFVLIK